MKKVKLKKIKRGIKRWDEVKIKLESPMILDPIYPIILKKEYLECAVMNSSSDGNSGINKGDTVVVSIGTSWPLGHKELTREEPELYPPLVESRAYHSSNGTA